MIVSSRTLLKRYNPNSQVGLPQNKRQKSDQILAHFETSLRTLGIKDQAGEDLCNKSINILAKLAYDVFFLDRKTPLKMEKATTCATLKKTFCQITSNKKRDYCLFTTRRLLGKGTSKFVFEAILIEMKEKNLSTIKVSSVALLYFEGNNVSQKAIQEDDLAALFQSPHIIGKSIRRIKSKAGYFLVQNRFAFDFAKAIKENIFLTFNQAVCALGDAAEGLGLLHANGIVHRDIKPANLAVKMDGRGMVFDLGLAQFIDRLVHVAGSPVYIAPETVSDDFFEPDYLDECCHIPQSPTTDLWAFGVSLYEILSPDHSLPGHLSQINVHESLHELCKTLLKVKEQRKIFHAKLFENWQSTDASVLKIQAIIRKLLSINPKKRGTAMELSVLLREIY